jgi:hypothetical protein
MSMPVRLKKASKQKPGNEMDFDEKPRAKAGLFVVDCPSLTG